MLIKRNSIWPKIRRNNIHAHHSWKAKTILDLTKLDSSLKKLRQDQPSHPCLSLNIDVLLYEWLNTDPAQSSVKYLTWLRTTSFRSSSSRNFLDSHSREDVEDIKSDLFENFYMVSGSHASTLDRLFAWERKLYDEVKVLSLLKAILSVILYILFM